MVTGAGGQLGRELARSVPPGCTLAAFTSRDCDIGDASAVSAAVARERPQVIINAAAYTAVDKAESDEAAAQRVNAQGPAHLAAAAASTGARLLHVSTDFVFDGSQGHPWSPDDRTHPLSVYGRTKLAGEAPVLQLGAQGLVLRTSWVYSVFGGNFVKTMLRLMSSHPAVRVVADQVGAPTWARGLAEALWCAARKPGLHGLHHWRDAGAASWYDFAVAICEEGVAAGLLLRPVDIVPIQTQDYPTPARRPGYSLLDCTRTWRELDLMPPHWRSQLRRMLAELKETHG
ncbi:MAG: dTDP-4-dehydrorhamnose reductase [Steroidobacteraceae bacterium]